MSSLGLVGYRRTNGALRAFTSIGSYPIVYLTRHGCLCAGCATSDGQVTDPHDPYTYLVGADIHWEGESLSCDGCNSEIESAYGAAS